MFSNVVNGDEHRTYYNIFLDCVTVGGGKIGSSCVFPFSWQGMIYNGCTTWNGMSPWCSTLVDDDGIHVGGGGYWGYCGSHCKIHTGRIT